MSCRLLAALALSLLMPACNLLPAAAPPQPTSLPVMTVETPAATPRPQPALTPTPVPSPTPARPDTGWSQLRPGLERRVIRLFDPAGAPVEELYLLRLEPAGFRFGVAYQARQPANLAEWQAETGALIVVNGGYYRVEGEEFWPAGLVIIDGHPLGRSYGSFAGMLAITAGGPELRWLQQTPYNPAEPLLAGLQSFPLLVKPGGQLGFPEQYEDGQVARRTVIGQDRHGRILFLVASQGYFTLHQLSRYLAGSDLELDIALNLDGGPSSGLLLAEPAEIVPALSTLPMVITVHPR